MFETSSLCHDKAVVAVKFSSCGKYLATASADKKACIFDINQSINPIQTLIDHTQGLNCCSWIGTRFLITGSDDKLVKVWDIETGKCISSLPGHKSFVYSLNIHPTTDSVVSGGYDGSIFISDIRSRFASAVIESHSKPVTSINFHPSGREYLTSSLDGFVRMWDFSFNSSQLHCCPCIASLYESKLTPV
jgi:COMPASS component SWD3